MLFELILFTGISLFASILPIYNIRQGLAFVFSIPFLGIILSLAYSLVVSWIMLKVFSFQSSVAGLANMLSAILFTLWTNHLGKQRRESKTAAA